MAYPPCSLKEKQQPLRGAGDGGKERQIYAGNLHHGGLNKEELRALANVSEQVRAPVRGGVQVLPPYPRHKHEPSGRYPTLDCVKNIADNSDWCLAQGENEQSLTEGSSNSDVNVPISRVKVKAFHRPKYRADKNYVSDFPEPSAPDRDLIYEETLADDDNFVLPKVHANYHTFTKKESVIPPIPPKALQGILKASPQLEVKSDLPSKGHRKPPRDSADAFRGQQAENRSNYPIPGKSSSSSSSNNSPYPVQKQHLNTQTEDIFRSSNNSPYTVQKQHLDTQTEDIFHRGPDSRPPVFRRSSESPNLPRRNDQQKNQQGSITNLAIDSTVRRRRESGSVPVRREANRKSGSLVWVTLPGGGAKLDWVATPHLSTLRSEEDSTGARVTRRGSECSGSYQQGTDSNESLRSRNSSRSGSIKEIRPPDRYKIDKMPSATSTERPTGSSSMTPLSSYASPTILKTSSNFSSSSLPKNVHRSASVSTVARAADGRSKTNRHSTKKSTSFNNQLQQNLHNYQRHEQHHHRQDSRHQSQNHNRYELGSSYEQEEEEYKQKQSNPYKSEPILMQTDIDGDDDCIVAVPGRASGQVVRIRVRPEVHAYLAGLPVASSPVIDSTDRRESIRSIRSHHSNNSSRDSDNISTSAVIFYHFLCFMFSQNVSEEFYNPNIILIFADPFFLCFLNLYLRNP